MRARPRSRRRAAPIAPATLRTCSVWRRCGVTDTDDGELNIDERLVTDLLAACRTVAAKLEDLAPQ